MSNSGVINQIELGDQSSSQTWVYLSGLTQSYDLRQEMRNRGQLDQIGRNLGVRFVAVLSPYLTEKLGGLYCWPHHTEEEVLKTQAYILGVLNHQEIDGYIGFSNGGYFLNRLAQIKKLEAPIITIAAAGYNYWPDVQNEILLINGKLDADNYSLVKSFFKSLQASCLKVHYFEHEKGHILPSDLVEEVMAKMNECHQT